MAYPESTEDDHGVPASHGGHGDVPFREPRTYVNPDKCFHYSASLGDVLSCRVFYTYDRKKKEYSHGVLFRYSDGSERAVGQCRIGVDHFRTVEQPRQLCIRKRKKCSPLYGLELAFLRQEDSVDQLADGEDDPWEVREMQGILRVMDLGTPWSWKIVDS